MEWVLWIMLGCNGWGCGHWQSATFPNKQECYEALKNVRIETNGNLATGNEGKLASAYCLPK